MNQPFDTYAEFYDLMYREKDYRGEAEYIAGLIREHHPSEAGGLHVLDLACGTGRHVCELADLGFAMQGSDISPKMVQMARQNALLKGKNITFFNESFQTCHRLPKQYDVIISMFSAIDYVTDRGDLLKSLRNVWGLLNVGGVFIFDYWNSAAVVSSYSPVRVLRKTDEKGELMRISETVLDEINQVATIHYSCLYWAGNERTEFEEIHRMRYHTFTEMELLLHAGGFEIIRRCPFMEPDRPVSVRDWNISIVARKRNGEPNWS